MSWLALTMRVKVGYVANAILLMTIYLMISAAEGVALIGALAITLQDVVRAGLVRLQ